MYDKAYYNNNKDKYKEASKKYYNKNKEKFKTHAKEYYINNKDKYIQAQNKYLIIIENRLFRSTKISASKRNLEHTISREDISDKLTVCCPILNIPFNLTKGYHEYNPSVDRIDSTKGYIPENIQITSVKANRMKSNATKEELIAFANWILDTYG